MPTPSATERTKPPEEIAAAAYGLWEQAGRPEGRDREFWFQAEQQLATKSASDPRAKKSGTRLATQSYSHATHH
jgi:hypothetical protein